MRKIVLVILVFALAGQAFAVKRTSPQKRVYKQQETHTLGWYITPAVKIAEIQDITRDFVGLRGGLIFDRSFYVGIAGYGLAQRDYYDRDYWDDWDYDNNRWELGYGGLEIGMLSRGGNNAQLALGVLVGGGAIDEYFDRWHASDGFFIVEPTADMLFRFNRHAALGLGVGYRFVDGVETPRFTDDDLDGPSFNISFQFGSF